MVAIARCTSSGFTSTSSTSNPAVANTWAIPLPMVPPPTTATRFTADDGPSARTSEATFTLKCALLGGRPEASHHLHRERHRVAATQTQGGEAGLLAPRRKRVDQR